MNRLPGRSVSEKMRTYWWLTQRTWHPFSEWIFSRPVHDGALAAMDPLTQAELFARAEEAPQDGFGARELLALRDQADDLIEEAIELLAAYQVVGIATTFFQNLPALALAKRIKQRWPDKRVVLGGANCDGPMGPALLRNYRFIDYVVCGEADDAFPAFLHQMAIGGDKTSIAGVLGRNDKMTIQGAAATPVTRMDDLPLPDFDDYVAQREHYGVTSSQKLVLALESSRGCWWGAKQHCVFCGLNATGMAYRSKSEERFRWELRETVRRYEAKFIFMTDNILPVEYHKQVSKWQEEITPKARLFYEIKSNVKRAQVKSLAEAGITAVQPGIESFSSSLLALMKKGVSAAQNVAFLRDAREFGIRVGYNLLVGFPGAPRSAYQETVRSLPSLSHLHPPSGVVPIEFHRFSPYHQQPASFGLRLRPVDAYSRLYPLPVSEIEDLAYMFTSEQPGDTGATDVMEQMEEMITRWREAYRPDDCTLTWEQMGEAIQVVDRRPGFARRRFSIEGYAREVFRQLSEPRTIRGLVRDARLAPPRTETETFLRWFFAPQSDSSVVKVEFEAEAFLEDPLRCLRPLLDADLLFVDEGEAPPDMVWPGGQPKPENRYVALPVHAGYQPEDVSWNSTGV